MPWTVEQVLGLAPDPGSAKAGKALASPRKWSRLGRTEAAVWGSCQGSGSVPYQVAVDLGQPAYRCSCPSYKRPCKHALGLFVFLASDPDAIAVDDPPAWVADWLQDRRRRAERVAARKESGDAPDREQQEKRAARRASRVQTGVDELDLWLRDLIRQGLTELPGRPLQFWTQPAQRMVDAQAPGLARMLNGLASVPYSGEGWPDRMLARLGRLSLVLEAYQRLDELPPDLQRSTRSVVGYTESRDEVLSRPPLTDEWLVLGRSVRSEDQLSTQRTWLRGVHTGRPALVLDFAMWDRPFDSPLLPGTVFHGGLHFFEGSPLRALTGQLSAPRPLDRWIGAASVPEALADCARLLSREPWSVWLPCSLSGVQPVDDGGVWRLADGQARRLPLHGSSDVWTLLALSGGRPIDVFGEWDGERLVPLSAFAEGRYQRFEARP